MSHNSKYALRPKGASEAPDFGHSKQGNFVLPVTTLGQKLEAVDMLIRNSNNEAYLTSVGKAFRFAEFKEGEMVFTISNRTPSYWALLFDSPHP